MFFRNGIWAGLSWICVFSQDLNFGLGFGLSLRGVFLYLGSGLFVSFFLFSLRFGQQVIWDLENFRAFVWFPFSSAVAGKSVLHHHCHSAGQRTELQWVYGDTGMMEMDWARGVYGNTRVAEMDRVTGSIYSGDPTVDSLNRILYHLISTHLNIERITHLIHRIFWFHSLCPTLRGYSQPCSTIPAYPLPPLLEPEQLIPTNSFWNAVRGAAEWWRWALCPLALSFRNKWSRNPDSGLKSWIWNRGKDPH